MTAAQTALLGSSDCQKLVWSDMAIVIAAKARCPTQESPSGHLVRRRPLGSGKHSKHDKSSAKGSRSRSSQEACGDAQDRSSFGQCSG